MKTWIIILFSLYLVFDLVQICISNYIKNDKMERLKYQFRDGMTTLGVWHGIFWILSALDLCILAVLILIYLL